METKAWYQSKAVWGGIIAVVSGILGLFGKQIDKETQEFLSQSAVELSTAVMTIIGGIVAIYGRIKADKLIK